MVRVLRFGRRVRDQRGPRLELLNAKAVITRAGRGRRGGAARASGSTSARSRAYRARMLDAALPDGRLHLRQPPAARTSASTRSPTAIDRSCARSRRRAAPTSRSGTPRTTCRGRAPRAVPGHALLPPLAGRADADRDLPRPQPPDRLAAERLRADGDPAPRRRRASACRPGAITVISHSLGVDPADRATARPRRRPAGRDDDRDRARARPRCARTRTATSCVSVDGEARSSPSTASRARWSSSYGPTARMGSPTRSAADMAVSLPSHALWLGRELAAKEQLLRARRTDRAVADELLARLRETRLRGPRRRARLRARRRCEVPTFDPTRPDARPALRADAERAQDPRAPRGAGRLRPRRRRVPRRDPLLPPVVERSEEPDGRTVWLINDGIHRVYAAHLAGSPINVVTVDGASHPYYALASAWARCRAGAAGRLPEEGLPGPGELQGAVPRLQRGLPGRAAGAEVNPAHLRA